MRPLHRFTVLPTVPEPLRPLSGLAHNLRWTWQPAVQDLFAAMDPGGWETSGHNPLRMLNETDAGVLERAAADPAFLARQSAAAEDLTRYLQQPRWYQTLAGAPRRIAYFSPEFGVSEVLPQYSGGLGVLAGDHLKAASDLGVPLVGVSLFYRSGYFRQTLTADGRQLEAYPAFNPQELPLELVTDGGGQPLRISVRLPDGVLLWAQIWRADVGRVPLFLLDSDVEGNAPAERAVTDRLYGGGGEHRLRQEILLGIGGVRALEALDFRAEVFHTNEGHAGFLGLERIRRLIQDEGLDPASAIEAVRAGTIFTTHTPVEAGIDRFPRSFVERYFGPSGVETGLEVDRIMELGAEPEGDGSMFNMAVMGLRLAQRANGVSRLHGQVSRELFHGLWAGFSAGEVPMRHVTNGVHAGTWVERDWAELFERYLGPDFPTSDRPWTPLAGAPDNEIWELRQRARQRLVSDVRRRMASAWRTRGASEGQLGWITRAFDPDVLTIGFARRVPSYKRLTLLLRDRERLTRLLLDPKRPIQLVIAGKAHPADEGGKEMIAEFARFAADPRVRHRIAFLPDYDMAMARTLVAGADVWLNNPLRPYEACGTSGMKAALNGSLNLSVRDGWWDECYDGENGWAIPSADDPSIPAERRDELEAAAIFDLLEHEIVPLFYDRPSGLSSGWVAKVRHSLITLGPVVLASRMVREYTDDYYLPAAEGSWRLQAGGFAAARELAAWKKRVSAAWPGVVVRRVSGGQDEPALGSRLTVRAVVELGDLGPDEVEVQIAYGRVDDADELREVDVLPLKQDSQRAQDGWVFEGEVPLVTPGAFGYTVRVVPRHPSLIHPAELGLVAWASG
ncbi:MAG TPA: alpha-glucan family phosphorylase [Actinomycetes bacterium]|jgi:starch phosphorylase|nr:alpha-glucan family phosphorylase [Actinomycetes bacterium]